MAPACYVARVLVGLETALPCDPVAVARKAATFVDELALLHASDVAAPFGRHSFLGLVAEGHSSALDPFEGDGAPPDSPFGWVPRWIGAIPYECRRSLERPGWSGPERRPTPTWVAPRWTRFAVVLVFDHHTGRVLAVGSARSALAVVVRRLVAAPEPSRVDPEVVLREGEAPERHVERIAAARELIARGDIYQVNLARPLDLEIRASTSGWTALSLALHERIARVAPTPFGLVLAGSDGEVVVGSSPELLLRADIATEPESLAATGRFHRLMTVPIKGTRPRGADACADRRRIDELEADPKEHAELTMIVDVERHDLGRVSTVGTVRVARPPEVVSHRTVHHRQAVLVACARPDAARREVFEAMLPSGSVTGAPKVRAMEVIADLEARRRGLYTGGVGFVAHDGSLTLAMAIRTLVAQQGCGEYLTGGGIVFDSDPARELDETRWKALQLARLTGGRLM